MRVGRSDHLLCNVPVQVVLLSNHLPRRKNGEEEGDEEEGSQEEGREEDGREEDGQEGSEEGCQEGWEEALSSSRFRKEGARDRPLFFVRRWTAVGALGGWLLFLNAVSRDNRGKIYRVFSFSPRQPTFEESSSARVAGLRKKARLARRRVASRSRTVPHTHTPDHVAALQLVHDLHAGDHLPEHGVAGVELRLRRSGDEELTPARIRPI